MTNTEAIRIIKDYVKRNKVKNTTWGIALDVAIRALEKPHCRLEKCPFMDEILAEEVDDFGDYPGNQFDNMTGSMNL